MAPSKEFTFSYGAFRPLLSILGLGPAFSRIAVDDTKVVVRFGWGFRAHIERGSISSVEPYDGAVLGIGVHGIRGQWLVNGSTRGLVEITLDPPSRASVMGFPVKLQKLRVSVNDPTALVSELRGR